MIDLQDCPRAFEKRSEVLRIVEWFHLIGRYKGGLDVWTILELKVFTAPLRVVHFPDIDEATFIALKREDELWVSLWYWHTG